nr:hypothetical protein GCM10025730_54030 [Promicromonospora thailandica]
MVSHDLALLELMDDTAELRAGSLTTFGGPYSEYRAWLEVQQEAAAQALRSAEQTLRREKRQRIEAEERIAHSESKGRKDAANSRYVKAVINDRRNSAEKSQGRGAGCWTTRWSGRVRRWTWRSARCGTTTASRWTCRTRGCPRAGGWWCCGVPTAGRSWSRGRSGWR